MGDFILILQKIQSPILPKVLIRLPDIQMVMLGKLTNEDDKIFYTVAEVHNS